METKELEERIVADYNRARKKPHYRYAGFSEFWILLARKYKMSCREVKDIARQGRIPRNLPPGMQPKSWDW